MASEVKGPRSHRPYLCLDTSTNFLLNIDVYAHRTGLLLPLVRKACFMQQTAVYTNSWLVRVLIIGWQVLSSQDNTHITLCDMGNIQEEGKLKMLRTGWWGKGNDTLSSGHDHGHNTDELPQGHLPSQGRQLSMLGHSWTYQYFNHGCHRDSWVPAPLRRLLAVGDCKLRGSCLQ